MTWIWISLLVWLALSPVVALFVGRAVTIAEKHRTHRSAPCDLAPPARPASRDRRLSPPTSRAPAPAPPPPGRG